MRKRTGNGRFLAVAFALLALSVLMLTPSYAATPQPQSLGLENPSKVMTVHVMLNMRNPDGLKSLTQQLHDKSSPNYHKFLTRDQFAAQFAPSAADSKSVADYLKAHGLTVTYIDKYNLVVSATGTVANLEKAFNTQIEKVQLNGDAFTQPTQTPTVSGNLAGVVKNVSGLGTMRAKSYVARVVDPETGKPEPPVKFNKATPNGVFFPSNCFPTNNALYNLKSPGLQAIYSGNGHQRCAYDPAELQHAYGFDSVISSGIDGTGQVITILDPYGSYTILSDANLFSSIYGLPALIPGSNFFQIYNPDGSTPDCVVGPGVQCGAELETSLDVEYAHAMAPGATIVLVTTATFTFTDLWQTDLWIAEFLPQGPVSHSYGAPESEVWFFDFPDYDDQYLVNEFADSVGFSYNYSSGDSGDFYGAGVVSSPYDVSFPAGSPNATSVGGTSLALTSTGGYKWEEGWGTNITRLFDFATHTVDAPPNNLAPYGFQGGAGGGTSQVTGAPAWQSFYLGNTWRQQPDVAFTADPYTGVEVIYTDYWDTGCTSYPYCTYVTPVGGTSVSCPMFSGVWALAEQKAGRADLGNAAPIAYEENALFPGSFNDVVPVGSNHNAHGTIFYGNVPVAYSQWDLAQPYENSLTFYETLYLSPISGNLYALSFGTDSSLTTNVGWDNVTGIGTPAGGNFISPF